MQAVEKNLDKKCVFILARQYFEKYFQKNILNIFTPKIEKISKFLKIQNFQNFEKKYHDFSQNFENFGFSKILKNFNFLVKILRIFLWKIFFKILSRQDEKTFCVQIFFYCLDYVSRLLKYCSEYSGNLKHASAVDSVSKLSLKMDGKLTNFSWESCFMSYPNQAF